MDISKAVPDRVRPADPSYLRAGTLRRGDYVSGFGVVSELHAAHDTVRVLFDGEQRDDRRNNGNHYHKFSLLEVFRP